MNVLEYMRIYFHTFSGEFDSCSEDEADALPPPIDPTPNMNVNNYQQQSNPDYPENQPQSNPDYSGYQQMNNPDAQEQDTANNIGYPKGEFDSDNEELNDYENYDPKSGTLKAQS